VNRCHNEGETDACLGEADESYTMNFSDVEPGAKLYWCSVCGPVAQALENAIVGAIESRPGFDHALEAALDEYDGGQRE
jgi:hypothetical protein